jgi:phosphate transport system substrate-binding protein
LATPFKFIVALAILAASSWQSCTCSSSQDSIRVDGSSTVYVISEAVAEEYKKSQSGIVSVSISGTGGGFKKLCSKRIDIIGASRAITDQEKEQCHKNSVEYLEIPIAYDGIVVAVNKSNDWLNHITVSSLKKIFEPQAEGKVVMWSDIDPAFPKRKFEIFAPGVSSGTYDYFTKAIVGKEHSSRGDITTSEDDNVLVHGIRTTPDSIGFFSFAYYLENKAELKALAVIDDKDPRNTEGVIPSVDSIRSGQYSPLSRPIFLYANKNLLAKPKEFIKFYVEHVAKVAPDVGFIPLSDAEHQKAMALVKD